MLFAREEIIPSFYGPRLPKTVLKILFYDIKNITLYLTQRNYPD